jgi:hypothetical protein
MLKWLKDKKKIEDSEDAGAVVKKVEYVCMAIKTPQMSFPDDIKILKDPNIWVSNSRATCDMTPYAGGVKKDKNMDPTSIVGIMGSGSLKMIGDFSTVMCDKYGNEKVKLKFKTVAVVPDYAFNLFSLTKRLKNSWVISGNKNCLILTKKGSK